MAVDTFVVYVGVYADQEAAEEDYELVKDLHRKEGLFDAYDAAVIFRREDGKVKITREARDAHPRRRRAGRGPRARYRSRRRPFPVAAIGGGLLAATAAGGAVLGAVAGHAAAGMSRDDLKELGEHLDAGKAGLVVVGMTDMGAGSSKRCVAREG